MYTSPWQVAELPRTAVVAATHHAATRHAKFAWGRTDSERGFFLTVCAGGYAFIEPHNARLPGHEKLGGAWVSRQSWHCRISSCSKPC